MTIYARGVEHLGRLFFMLESAFAVAGCALQLNPSDQPQLQPSEDNAARALEPSTSAVGDAGNGDLRSLIEGLEPPAHLAIIGYLPSSDAVGAAVGRLRAAVRDASGAATTFGYGPRRLRSAGQLNKGGAATGVSLQLGQERDRDLEIPGRGYSFGRVIDTRAQPDLSAPGARGVKVARVRLPADDPAGAFDELVGALGEGSG